MATSFVPALTDLSADATENTLQFSGTYNVLSDVSVTVTLPASAVIGDKIVIADYGGSFAINNCIVNRNGHRIMGYDEDFILHMNNITVEFIYVDTTQGWRILNFY